MAALSPIAVHVQSPLQAGEVQKNFPKMGRSTESPFPFNSCSILMQPHAIPVHLKPIFVAVQMGAYPLVNGTKNPVVERWPRAKATTKTAAVS